MPTKLRAPEQLVTERLILRKHTMDDLPAFTSFVVDKEATRFLLFPEDKKTPEGACWMLEMAIANYETDVPHMSIAITGRDSGAFLGSCGLSGLGENSFEVYYAVLPAHQGKGIASEAMRALVDYSFRTLGIDELVAFVSPENEPSVRVAEKLGFARGELAEHMGRVGWQYSLKRV
jgi:ribosomal-protein-alanine N-acetyltransferase